VQYLPFQASNFFQTINANLLEVVDQAVKENDAITLQDLMKLVFFAELKKRR
jgi:hypothetical protein